MNPLRPYKIAVVGSGPAGLMCAHQLAEAQISVTLFEKRKSTGRKLLIAGSSGLNITHDCPTENFHKNYTEPQEHFKRIFQSFSPKDWIQWIEKTLEIPTFKGTSHRYFVEGMKASQLLKNWNNKLKNLGVIFMNEHELIGFKISNNSVIELQFSHEIFEKFDAVCFALGGASYEPTETPLRWPEIFKKNQIRFMEFQPSNTGFEVEWPAAFLQEAEGKPIKNILLSSKKGTKKGELMITQYGLEGTPIYSHGTPGTIYLDLKPQLSLTEVIQRLSRGQENLSPFRRMKKYLEIGEAAESLVFHLLPKEAKVNLQSFASYLKHFPIELKRPRPLSEAISSSGGVAWDEVDQNLMLRQFRGIFLAGEMLDWDTSTGGFLIQAAVSQGHFVAQQMKHYLKTRTA